MYRKVQDQYLWSNTGTVLSNDSTVLPRVFHYQLHYYYVYKREGLATAPKCIKCHN